MPTWAPEKWKQFVLNNARTEKDTYGDCVVTMSTTVTALQPPVEGEEKALEIV